MRIGLLISGSLGNIVLHHLIKNHNIIFILTDKKSIEIIEECKKNNIKTYIGNPRNNKISSFIKNVKIEVLISANYLFLIEHDLINLPSLIAFNIHGSLLPKYRGRTPHVWAIINGEKETGITAHEINLKCDEGDILYQKKIKINADNTGADILLKFKNNYTKIIDVILKKTSNNSLIKIKQNNSDSSFFGKRTPDDGGINWGLSMKQIKDWIRAQAYPYPGAFTYYESKKIIIDKVSFTNLSFDKKLLNGTIILKDNYTYVKVKDGFLKIEKVRNKVSFKNLIRFKNEN